MVDFQCKERYGWEDLIEITRLLRGPGGCPWDAEQTHGSIRRNFLEETYEVLDAIDRDDAHDMCEELGDVLMQVALHAQMETERGRFTMADVVNGVAQKLVYRHPHVFGGAMAADNSEQVLANWETLKRREKGQRSTADAIEAVPHTLPALWRAEKIQSKTAKAGFNWDTISGALDKLEEEVRELRQAVENSQDPSAPHGIREEAGDVLFIVSKIAQLSGVDPEDALHRACDKFDARFRLVEEAADKPLTACTEEELVRLWESAKRSCLNTHPRLRNKLRTISCRRI
ncbi:MAG: nucleoside triphosphate pyrophosphohydrolase [Oscillospiraceae bacterium]